MPNAKELHPAHESLLPSLKRAQGQVNAVSRMIEEKKYCPDIIQQLRAATAALKSIEATILRTHLEHCVQSAMKSKSKGDRDKKIEELISIFKRGNE